METSTSVRIRLASALAVDCGGRTLVGGDLGSRKGRTLLALLAAERRSVVTVDQIVEALWPGGPPCDPAANVATLVSRLRRLLGPNVLATGERVYGFAESGRWTVDLDEAASLLGEATQRTAADEPALAAAAAQDALEILGAHAALPDEGDDTWVVALRLQVDEQRRRCRHLLAKNLTAIDPAAAVDVALTATQADPLDEQAVRDLMWAFVADGRPSAALTAYADVAGRLRDELATLPDHDTAGVQLAILRGTQLPGQSPDGDGLALRVEVARVGLVGRESELATADRAWAQAGTSAQGHLLLVEGEAGIGKTRFLDAVSELAAATGGRVLPGRCHPTERSLFLQPFMDAVRPALLESPLPRLSALLRDHEAAWIALIPDLAPLLHGTGVLQTEVDLQRAQAFDAVLVLLRRLAQGHPVLLTIDDLHDGGAATADLLGYLAPRLSGSRVLVVVAIRAEDATLASRLVDRAVHVQLGTLPRSAVDALAAAAGLAGHGAQVMARTAGHPLSVVESLRALADGDTGVPASLADAVLARVGRLAPTQRTAVEAAAVLRRRIDPRLLAALLETSELTAVRQCEALVGSRLVHRAGNRYEFANDLLQECIHAALPPAVAAAYHRRAAELTADQPEVMAEHAYAAGDAPRAAHGWLLAGKAALHRGSAEDAIGLLDRSLAVDAAPVGTRARALLARARAHEAQTAFDAALADVDAALTLAQASGDRRLEMTALRARSGDAAVGRRESSEALAGRLQAGLQLAAGLGDRVAEADFSSRLVILDTHELRLASALDRAERAVARARAAGSSDALFLALDGLKTTWSYLGVAEPLRAATAELETLARARDDTWLLQWAVFESSFAAAAEGRYDQARALVRAGRGVNAKSGYSAFAGYMQAFDAWFARLAGDLDEARRIGGQAVTLTSRSNHPWWYATAAGLLAATLLDTGDHAEALAMARRGVAAAPSGADAGRLRCLAALAVLTGDPDDLEVASAGLAAVECPPALAWVAGADCYLLVAQAALALGDPVTARVAIEPLRAPTMTSWPAIRAPYSQLQRACR